VLQFLQIFIEYKIEILIEHDMRCPEWSYNKGGGIYKKVISAACLISTSPLAHFTRLLEIRLKKI